MATETPRDPDFDWLDMLQPTGLVAGRNLLRELGLIPERQTKVQSAEAEAFIEADTGQPALKDPWGFFAKVLGWEARLVVGSPDGPALGDSLTLSLKEQQTTLAPAWAVREPGNPEQPWQLLVRIETGVAPDKRCALAGWEASAQQRFERLLRETQVFAGVLITDTELRLVYAPRGETSGWLSFPIRALATVAGRPMLGGLKLLLDRVRLFTDADARRLPALMKKSRDAQAAVSTALAEQVLGALHELLRGLDLADGPRIRVLAKERPGHLYEGLLTVLMRLVFILYAEDRDLLPSRIDARARELYEGGYSVRGLFGRLAEDQALNPDTMDERRGAWGRLLALFRLIHKGHPSHFVQARGGKLFDPDAFPFLEGRDGGGTTPLQAGDAPRVLTVSDGCILRVLAGLMTLKGPNGRERLSYRSLDVEQIGSVYEIVMGFKVETAQGRALAIRAGKSNRTPVFVDLDALLTQKGKERIKYLKEEADRGQLSAGVGKAVEAAKTAADLAAALDGIVDERASPRKRDSAPGTPILQPTDERRRTGSHYTPRSLTAPIVQHALEPAFDRLGDDATPEQILDLKVCDPAMGSGAFLVEACRALGERLVKAWERWPAQKPAIPADEDEDLHARRLVAQRCLYGVDKNPLATDLAKLSLWLATLARDHEFTFLDHALKSGDSLVGLTSAQIAAANWDVSSPQLQLFRQVVERCVGEVMKGRAEIRAAPDDTARAIQEARHRSVESRIAPVRSIGDAVIAAFFAENRLAARENRRREVEGWLVPHGKLEADWDKLAAMAATLKQGDHPLPPFYWEIDFPEVFARANSGFDAIVGNPPFSGMVSVSRNHKPGYIDWLQTIHVGAHGNSDLVAHFFLQAFNLLNSHGCLGLIATNTISQGDTRQTGLRTILQSGGSIARVIRRLAWPGEAAVVVSVLHITKLVRLQPVLDHRSVGRISAYLVNGNFDENPFTLSENRRIAAAGSKIYGNGFTFDDEEAKKGAASPLSTMTTLIGANAANAARILPYIGGEEVANGPQHAHRRYTIDFGDLPLARTDDLPAWDTMLSGDREECLRRGIVPADYADPVAEDWPQLLEIVKRLVKPSRDKEKRPARRERWWKFGERQPGLYRRVEGLISVLVVNCGASPHLAIAVLPTGVVYAHSLVIFPFDKIQAFTLLQSRPHECWARFFASSMKDDLRYTPSDCFETFPFPLNFSTSSALESAGRAYHDHRAAIMVARNEGMTKTYNRFHDLNATTSSACASCTPPWTAPCSKPMAGTTSRRAPSRASSTRTARTTTPTRAACSGPPTSATKSSPASSPSTPPATPKNSASELRRGDGGDAVGGMRRRTRVMAINEIA
jgi:hypothetical protein